MITQIKLDDLGAVNLVPQAVVARPVTYFTNLLGYKFERNRDDLDEYEGAFFRLGDELPFALIHYRGNPPDRTTRRSPFTGYISS